MVRPTEDGPMLVSYPNRVVTYVTDEQLAALRACVARESYRYPSISRLLCHLVAVGLAARRGGGTAEAAAFSLTYLPPSASAKHSRKRHR
jgi:hypothetical protein